MKFTILRYDTIGSTNDEALSQARKGADEGLCVIARNQTAGRGRHGRAWISPPDAGLPFSVILRPTLEMRFLSLITLMTGIAVHDMLEETFGLDCDIKWANDIHINGKKICGILAESCETNIGLAVIVGIGLNLKKESYPLELTNTATSIKDETGSAPNLEIVLNSLTKHLASCYETLQGLNGAAAIQQEWTKKSSYAVGKDVRVVMTNETIFGVTRGIEYNGALRVETENGEIKVVQAGDIENLRLV